MLIIFFLPTYIAGYLLSFTMLRIEHESEGRVYTRGDRLISHSFSFGSFLTVIIILVITWIKKIGLTGYWSAPVKPIKKEDAAK